MLTIMRASAAKREGYSLFSFHHTVSAMKSHARKLSSNPVHEVLQRQQGSHTVLAFKTRAAHWQMTGLHFNHLHELLGKHYERLDALVDELAERNRMVRGAAVVGLAAAVKSSELNDFTAPMCDPEEFLGCLLADHERLSKSLHRDAETAVSRGDLGTNDFLIGLLQEHQKMAWFYRASLNQT
jgi:starvation-inducible DNA-binding protein